MSVETVKPTRQAKLKMERGKNRTVAILAPFEVGTGVPNPTVVLH